MSESSGGIYDHQKLTLWLGDRGCESNAAQESNGESGDLKGEAHDDGVFVVQLRAKLRRSRI